MGRLTEVVGSAKLTLLRMALAWTPALDHAVVTGFPDDEGNSVETVRAAARRLPVYWLTSDSAESLWWLISDGEARYRVRCLRKDSVGAHLAYITARYVFFTHGLYGSPPPPPHKIFVNLWHGDGPKRSKRFANVRSTYAVAGTRLWGAQRPVYFGVSEDGVLVTGNPRVDQFARPPGDETMRRLGLDPRKPLVLWMPTYRRTEYRGRRLGAVRNWADAEELSRTGSVRDLAGQVAEVARRLGVTVAVKPHPLDADGYAALGMPVVSGDDLRREEVTLYQLMGRSSGLLTDYSSVWTDYLAVDRPIGFYCPDLDDYQASRGLNVEDYDKLIPGPLLESVTDFEDFLRNCIEESAPSRELRSYSRALVGAETRLGASDRLLDALDIPVASPCSTAGSSWLRLASLLRRRGRRVVALSRLHRGGRS
jgi:CDP-Glycerol:Poly(glycerophosphate) glycerophosphotransferase